MPPPKSNPIIPKVAPLKKVIIKKFEPIGDNKDEETKKQDASHKGVKKSVIKI